MDAKSKIYSSDVNLHHVQLRVERRLNPFHHEDYACRKKEYSVLQGWAMGRLAFWPWIQKSSIYLKFSL